MIGAVILPKDMKISQFTAAPKIFTVRFISVKFLTLTLPDYSTIKLSQVFYIEKLTRFTRRDITLMHVGPAIIVFAAFFTITVFSYLDAKNNLQTEQKQILDHHTASSRISIEKRMGSYEDVLSAATGLFNASDTVTAEEWKEFINIFELPERFPGIEGVGFVKTVPGDTSHANIVYIEPMSEKNTRAVGFDMYSDPLRVNALNDARDIGQTVITSRLRLVQDPPDTTQPAVIMLTPLYKKNSSTETLKQRRANIQGYIFGQLYTDALISETFNAQDPNYGFRVVDKSTNREDAVLYESPNFENAHGSPGSQSLSQDFKVNNRTWSITGGLRAEVVPARERNRPASVLAGGLLFSLFLAGFIYLLLLNRSRALMHKEESDIQSAKDELLALASHQLRTPATGVKQYIGMLREGYAGKLTAEQRKYLDEAYESNERQLNTINEMLAVARVDAGNIELSPRRTDLTALVKDILKEHARTIKEYDLTLIREIPSRHIYIMADPQYIRMAIENIVNNAAKYTPRGGQVKVSLKKSKKFAQLTITDTGVGVRRKHYPLLFRKFSRIPNDLTSQVSGTGIGLYLAKKIADAHGGNIEFASTEGIGSICKIRLPVGKDNNVKERL